MSRLADLRWIAQAGLAGAIAGRALYGRPNRADRCPRLGARRVRPRVMLEAALVVLLPASVLAALTNRRRTKRPPAPRSGGLSGARLARRSACSCSTSAVPPPGNPQPVPPGSCSTARSAWEPRGGGGGRLSTRLGTGAEVRIFRDEQEGADTVPNGGRSLLFCGAGRRGGLGSSDDRGQRRGDRGRGKESRREAARARVGLRLLPRAAVPDLAITSLDGPARVTARDSIAQIVEREAGAGADTAAVGRSCSGSSIVARRRIRLGEGASGRARLVFPSRGAGDHLLRVRLAGRAGDREPRTDTLGWIPSAVAPTHGRRAGRRAGGLGQPVPVSDPAREVAQLPVRGYVRLNAGLGGLRPVGNAEVALAARGADHSS